MEEVKKEKVQCPQCKKSVAEKADGSINCPHCGPQKDSSSKTKISTPKGARSKDMKPKYEPKNQKKSNGYKNEGGPEYEGSYGSEDY